jgi:hypothetical protein
MSAFNKFNFMVQDLGDGLHDLNSDTLNVMLTNTAPVATNHVYADISATELANGNGYTTGGAAVTANAYSQSAGTATLSGTGPVFTASGAMGPFRYAVLYNQTAAGQNLIGWWDYGSSITLATGETFTVSFGASILTVA